MSLINEIFKGFFYFIFSIKRLPLSREAALKIVVDALSERDVVVSTTGMLSRELYELR